MNIEEIKKNNIEAGRFFFSPETMRFFGSRVHPAVYEGPGGIYFVTSEQPPHGPRTYTVHQALPEGRYHGPGALIITVSHHPNRNRAHADAHRRAAVGRDVVEPRRYPRVAFASHAPLGDPRAR